jgi:glycosyltransferase involved in cell wall biosynthesis
MSLKVSVIIPCYQAEATLEATLRSVAVQRLRAWECIVVNDGSTDASPRIAEQYAKEDGRFRVLHQQNAGLSAARNAGIANANAPYLHFLDADDLVAPHAYQQFAAGLDSDPAAVVCYCSNYTLIDGVGKELSVWATPPQVHFAQLLEANFAPPVCAVVRQAVVDKVSGFAPSLSGLADWDFWLRVARIGGKFVRVGGTLVSYRVLAGSMSKNTRRMYHDARLVRNLLAEPDRRIRSDEAPFPRGLPSPELDRLLVNYTSYYLGCAVAARDGELVNEILAELDLFRQASPAGNWFRPEVFSVGVKYTSQPFAADPAGLARSIAGIYEGVRFIEQHVGSANLFERVLESLLTQWHEAVVERDRLLASTSYRLGRFLTRFKPW